MDDLNRIMELAGVKTLDEMSGSETQQLARQVMKIAEANMYDASAEAGVGVKHDDVFNEAKRILGEMESHIYNYLESDINK